MGYHHAMQPQLLQAPPQASIPQAQLQAILDAFQEPLQQTHQQIQQQQQALHQVLQHPSSAAAATMTASGNAILHCIRESIPKLTFEL